MNILITGGTGFIGRNMLEQLKGYQLFAPRSSELNLLNREDLLAYVKANKIELIIDCSCWNAYINPNKAENLVFINNVKMFFNISCCSSLVKKIIYFGSGAEFDRASWKSMMGEDYFGMNIPRDDYGLSKYINCLQIKQAQNIYNLRIFGVFGPHEDYHKRFISYCIVRALSNKKIEMNQNCFFDYLYIDDLVKITDKFIKQDFKHRIYNVCTGKRFELADLAQRVLKITGSHAEITVKKPGLNSEYTGDNSLLLKEIEYKFEDIDKSIKKLAEWYSRSTF